MAEAAGPAGSEKVGDSRSKSLTQPGGRSKQQPRVKPWVNEQESTLSPPSSPQLELTAALGIGLAAAVLSFVPDWRRQAQILSLLAAAGLGLWILRRPWRWFAVFATATLLLPPFSAPIGNSGPHLALGVVALGTLAAAAHAREWDARWGALEAATFALAAIAVSSSGWAWFYSGPTVAAGSFARAALLGVSAFAVLDIRRGPAGRSAPENPAGFLRLLFRLGAAVALFGCLDFLLQLSPPAGFAEQYVWLSTGVVRRAQGVFYEAGLFGNVCVFFLIGLGALTLGPRRWILSRPELALTSIALLAALLFSFSRAAFLNLLAGAALLVWLNRHHPRLPRFARLAAAGAALAATAAALAAPEFTAGYARRFLYTAGTALTDPAAAIGDRWLTWQALAQFLAEHPWRMLFGVGFTTLPHSEVAGRPLVVDNMFLSLLAETGVVGLAAASVLLAVILRTAARAARSADPAASLLGTWSLCFWTGQIVQMFWVDLLTFWRVLPLYLGLLAWADLRRSKLEAP